MTDSLAETSSDSSSGDHRSSGSRGLTVTFIAATALGSALLFLVEPLIVRMMLPLLGGSPAIWNTAMVFFQGALLTGYLMAHLARRKLPWSSRPWVQIAFVALGLLVLPVTIPNDWVAPIGDQAIWILAALTVALGIPFVALAMLGPTLQGWFADTSDPRHDAPYFLYAAGNTGSIVGLLSYPLLVEPFIGLKTQSQLWAVGYGILIVLLVASAVLRMRHPARHASVTASASASSAQDLNNAESAPPSWRVRGTWLLLAAVPSGLLLAVTQHISTDVASIPLLWVIPLTIYLATFVIAFSKPTDGCPPTLGRVAALMVLFVVALLPLTLTSSAWLIIGLVVNLGAFGLVALAIHFELAGHQPPASQLTDYYLWIAVGGLVGGIGVALVAPIIFNSVAEYPLLLAAALGIFWWTPFAHKSANRRYPKYVAGATILAVLLVGLFEGSGVSRFLLLAIAVGGSVTYLASQSQPRVFIATVAAIIPIVVMMAASQPTLHQMRSFFGVLRVTESDGTHNLENGSTIHGSQQFDPAISVEPTSYYKRDSGVGRIMQALTADAAPRRIAVVGLGAGTLATYGRTSDYIEFFEIDQAVLDIADNPDYFTYLSDTQASVTTNIIDGRIGLSNSDGNFDLIVLDAFSSDAIPVHLLTREAVGIYADQLSPTGVIAVHISNRHFDLEPVVSRVASEFGLQSHVLRTAESNWVLLSDPNNIGPSIAAELVSWIEARTSAKTPLWTDDYTNLLSTFIGF
ncbi:MAG: fused MFS/spermidine synthase [Actinomycetia bacterium]|nr:fused MFS/spermidine synthase [Actinomycetes bacterium]